MPRLHDLQPSFNAGELSPRLSARTDFEKFKSGLEILENMIPLSEGGVMRRSGSRYVAATKDSFVKSRLKRFQFNTEQAYIIEMGNTSFRFYKNQQRIEVEDVGSTVINGEFDADVSSWTDDSNGTGTMSWDSSGIMLLSSGAAGNEGIGSQAVSTTSAGVEHVIRFNVVGLTGNSLTFRIGSTLGASDYLSDFIAPVGYHAIAFTPAATTYYIQYEGHEESIDIGVDDVFILSDQPMELQTPYPESILYEVEGPQSADVLYLFYPLAVAHKLERRGDTTWSLVQVEFSGGPWLEFNLGTTTLTPSATTGTAITITASSTDGINGNLGFVDSDVGRLVRIDNPASGIEWGWALISNRNSSTVVTAQVKEDFATTNASTRWRLGAWSNTTGHPSKGTFFQERLYVANSPGEPQAIWGSQTDDFQNMTPDSDPTSGKYDGTIEDNDALKMTLSADDVNSIRWLRSTRNVLSVGTSGGEWIPDSLGVVITPLDRTITRHTTHGSANVEPVLVDNAALFVQRSGRKIRQFIFTFESDGFEAFDMNRLARHIIPDSIVEMDFAEEPDSLLWVVREDGVLASMTFRSHEDVVGWARHILGGSFDGGNAVVESIAVIPGADGSGQIQNSQTRDEVWIIVKRTIDGTTRRYVEVLERDFEIGHAQEDAYYLDSMGTYDGAATLTITGVSHLEGETVKLWVDGGVHDDKVVTAGAITLDFLGSVVQYGLPYTHKLKTLKFEGGNASGTMLGKNKRIYGITFAVLNSHTITFGPDESNLTEVDFRVVSDPMDSPAPLYTGEKFSEFKGGWDTDARIVIESDLPAPFTLLAMAPEISLNALK